MAAGGSTVNRGTVLRLTISSPPVVSPALQNVTQIGSGFAEHLDPAALVIGPTGVGLGPNGTLYVADTVNNQIQAVYFVDDFGGPSPNGQTNNLNLLH